MKYKSKSYEVDAIQFIGGHIDELMGFIEGNVTKIERLSDKSLQCSIQSTKGTIIVPEGSYIVKGSDGDFTIIKPDDFNRMYEVI